MPLSLSLSLSLSLYVFLYLPACVILYIRRYYYAALSGSLDVLRSIMKLGVAFLVAFVGGWCLVLGMPVSYLIITAFNVVAGCYSIVVLAEFN